MILLDTNAVLWLLSGHPRAAPLAGCSGQLRLSPVSLLEVRFLQEVGRVSAVAGHSVEEIVRDPRWKLDSPSAARLFEAALPLSWTRDPFDRMLVAHASYRGWRFATGDRVIKTNLAAEQLVVL